MRLHHWQCRRMLRSRIALPLAAALASLLVAATAANAHAFTFNSHWGGFGTIAGWHHEDLCSLENKPHGGAVQVTVQVEDGPVEHVVSESLGKYRDGTLLCTPTAYVNPNSTGPEDDGGFSVRCPHGEKPLHGGAGFTSKDHGDFSQVHGGFGHHHDGYWHYRFHNQSRHSHSIRFWAVCVSNTQVPPPA
jgi:hypothetical protein